METAARLLIYAGSVVAASLPASVYAQSAVTTPSTAGTTADRDALPDIIVTAERRSSNALKTPIAISVLSADQLAANQVRGVEDLQRVAPALSVSDNGITKYVNIRGIGLGVSAPGVANGVAYFIDGLFLPSAPLYQGDPYYDLARVEVLRGPQGTIVGQSSTGGAVYVVSQRAKLGVTEGAIEQSIGNYRDVRTQGMINLPIGDDWAIRFAGQFEDRESFYTVVSPAGRPAQGRVPGDLTRYAGRVSIFGQIGALDVTLRSEVDRKLSGGTTGKPIPGDPVDPTAVAAAPADPFTLGYDAPTRDNVLATENSVELNLKLGEAVTLRSLSGITTGERHFAQDTDGSPLAERARTADISETNYSQEFNLLSTGQSAFQWVVGGFELYQRLNGTNVFLTQSPPFSVAAPAVTIAHGEQGNNSFGVFGQGTLRLSPVVEIVGGLRYSIDHTESFDTSYVIQGGRPARPNPGAQTSRALTGKAALNLTLSPEHFLYFTASRGYKAGGFNDATSTFAPETIWNYEAGLKSSFANNTIRTQLTGYYDRYSNIQVTVYDPVFAFSNVANGTSATLYGFEAQGEARFGGLHIDASGAYNHSRLESVRLIDPRLLPFAGTVPLCPFFGPCTFDFTPYTVNLQGQTLPFAPHWTGHIGAEYEIPLGAGRLTPRIGLSYLGAQFASLFSDVPADVIPARTLIDLQIRYETPKGLSLQFYMTNVTNKTYIAGKFEDLQYYGSPRQFGVRIGYRLH